MSYKKLQLSLLIVFTSALLFGQNKKIKNESVSLPIILFVCEHGAARSTIAAAYFNKMANKKGLKYKAIFRGTNPDSSLTPATNKGLIEDGFETKNMKPIIITQPDVNTASRIITFDCTLPSKDSLSNKILKWNGIPPISKDYTIARNEIVSKVELLIAELKKKKSHR